MIGAEALGSVRPRREPAAGARLTWRTHLLGLATVWIGILALFHRDAAHMVSIWWDSSTFNHCLLIPPIICWLIWQRLPQLREIAPAAWFSGLVPLALGGLLWLLGEAGGLALARHSGLVVMLQGAVIACLGKAAARGLTFPLFYALFLIPAGDQLVPMLQTVTAQIATFLLGLSGIPAHLEGVFITTPSGYFEVAEACAGAKFLIAMVAFGALVANVCFRSWPRRLAFLAVSIAVPILANGVRAWGTVFIADRTSIAFAAGFDHVVYGGIFFALVIALILAVGWRYFDRGVDDPWFDPARLKGNRPAPPTAVAAAAVALAVLPMLWAAAVSASGARPAPQDFVLPEVSGWRRVAPVADWRPHFAGADLFRMGRYRDARGREVDLAVVVYARQSEGRELVGQGNGAVPSGGSWAWTADAPAPPGGRAERIASHGVAREVVSFYRVGDVLSGSGARVKLEAMRVRLLGGPQRAAAVLVSAQTPASADSARPAIDDFLRELGPVDRLADRASGLE
jgi:exosortase A